MKQEYLEVYVPETGDCVTRSIESLIHKLGSELSEEDRIRIILQDAGNKATVSEFVELKVENDGYVFPKFEERRSLEQELDHNLIKGVNQFKGYIVALNQFTPQELLSHLESNDNGVILSGYESGRLQTDANGVRYLEISGMPSSRNPRGHMMHVILKDGIFVSVADDFAIVPSNMYEKRTVYTFTPESESTLETPAE